MRDLLSEYGTTMLTGAVAVMVVTILWNLIDSLKDINLLCLHNLM